MTEYNLNPEHLKDLEKSGLSIEAIKRAGYRSINGGWVIPITDPLSGQEYYLRKRLDNPVNNRQKKLIKYVSPVGSEPHLYFSKQIDNWKEIFESDKAIWITEGEKKADKLIQEGLIAVAVSGVWCWSHDHEPIEDLNLILNNERIIYICFDSDYKHKVSVQKAIDGLKGIIEDRGCIPIGCHCPGPQKGIDDWLAKNNSIQSLLEASNRMFEEWIEKNSYEMKVEKAAMDMLKNPSFVDTYLEECNKFGLIGETNNKVQVYLENCSRLTKEPNGGISSKGQAPTAVGKTTLYKVIGKTFFKDDFIVVTDRSPKVMLRMGKHDWQYKILMTEENYKRNEDSASEDKDYQMRIAKSEGVLTYHVLIPDPELGQRVVECMLEGPFVFQEPTTKLDFNDEDLNRDMIHNFDESVAQTAKILYGHLDKISSLECYNKGLERKFIIDKHCKIQEILKDNIPDGILIPFAKRIKFPTHLHRARRDLPRLLRYIQVSTFIHFLQRKYINHTDSYNNLTVLTENIQSSDEKTPVFRGCESSENPAGIEFAGQSLTSLTIAHSGGESLQTRSGTEFGSIAHSNSRRDPCVESPKVKKILIAEEKDWELVEKYVIPDIFKEYTQIPTNIYARYQILTDRFGCFEEFGSVEAGEVLGVAGTMARRILSQLEKMGFCKINRDSRCYKYQMIAKNMRIEELGMIRLEKEKKVENKEKKEKENDINANNAFNALNAYNTNGIICANNANNASNIISPVRPYTIEGNNNAYNAYNTNNALPSIQPYNKEGKIIDDTIPFSLQDNTSPPPTLPGGEDALQTLINFIEINGKLPDNG